MLNQVHHRRGRRHLNINGHNPRGHAVLMATGQQPYRLAFELFCPSLVAVLPLLPVRRPGPLQRERPTAAHLQIERSDSPAVRVDAIRPGSEPVRTPDLRVEYLLRLTARELGGSFKVVTVGDGELDPVEVLKTERADELKVQRRPVSSLGLQLHREDGRLVGVPPFAFDPGDVLGGISGPLGFVCGSSGNSPGRDRDDQAGAGGCVGGDVAPGDVHVPGL